MTKLDIINELVRAVQDLDFVEDAYLDEDCAPEGSLSINIVIEEDSINEVCEELGYNVNDWEDELKEE